MRAYGRRTEMSSPRHIEAGAIRARRIAVAFVTALLLACVPAVFLSGLASAGDAITKAGDDITKTRHELRHTRERIRERRAKIRALQRHMNALATRISKARAEIGRTEAQIAALQRKMTALRARGDLLQSKLDEHNRAAYMFGGVQVMYVLTATSAADAASRMSFLAEMNRRDAVLAAKVQENAVALSHTEADVVRAQNILELTKRSLEMDQRELDEKMAKSQRLLAGFRQRADEIRYELSQLRPFAVCPVDGPVAIADDFGIMVHHPKNQGGDHIHQGNDMMAAMGTPIVAPFDGVAVDARNHIGGLAVDVMGEFGYVYNAHLSAYGELGPVETGDVIGYVGATGNAGGPHDHFEWHPDNGPAVDPHAFLLLVCDEGVLPS
jgi:murein DD-endopeptidase MepM/ murein hydrolase activator NlpD